MVEQMYKEETGDAGWTLILHLKANLKQQKVISPKESIGLFLELVWTHEICVYILFAFSGPTVWSIDYVDTIASNWGHFIEVDDSTQKEASFDKGRFLIATEISKKIEGEVQVLVDGSKYMVRVEEEDSYRVVTSSSMFSSSGPRPIEEEDDVDRTNDEVDDDCTGGKKQVDDLAILGKSEADKESINEPSLNPDMLLLKGVPHQTRVEQETEGTTTTLIVTGNKGLVSFVQDSQSPSQVESQALESTNKAQVSEAQEEIRGYDLVRQQEDDERTAMSTYGPMMIERPSQVPGIELEVDLNQRNIRKAVRSQMYEECMSSNGVNFDDETYIST
ncbi:hypothetical protein RHMOL_Rhmol10G0154200 [Rhododendron molle]|uniref:Uncharacterized protein n=1 Tax=Rhododendron molle TaxID=49168 RepID=A0ACC0M339_RHOML|nr:hypothetical protein RHMOL_Rhmol10G0154200 [Rhododendron molle]